MKRKESRSYFNGLEIEKPFNCKKKYKIVTLENDLEVLLISDNVIYYLDFIVIDTVYFAFKYGY